MNRLDGSDWLDAGAPDDPEQAPPPEDIGEIEEQHSSRRRTIILLIIILIILLLLWPVSDQTKKRVERGRRRIAQAELGEKQIGETSFRFFSGGPVFKFPGDMRFIRATPIRLSFTVHNLSSRTRNLGYAAVKLTDEHKQSYRIHPDLTARWYESRGEKLPWEQEIKGDQSLKVEAVFLVRKGPPKFFHLEGRDLDWESVKFVDVGGGKYATVMR